MKDEPEIQVYCTVDSAELEQTEDGLFCTRCQQRTVELDDSDLEATIEKMPQDRPICGVLRKLVPPALISSLALAGCAPTKPGGPPPGMLFHSGEKDAVEASSYPEAAWAVAQPGLVVSPYTGEPVQVSHLPAESLVLDPAFKMSDKKYFRLPGQVDG